MSPSIPYVERIAAEDDVIPLSEPIMSTKGVPLAEITIKKGQILQLPYVAINRLGWADGHVFRPARWLDEKLQPESNHLPRGWSGTLAFGDGPRNCVGFRLGTSWIDIQIGTHN
jgi:cytochrome P450